MEERIQELSDTLADHIEKSDGNQQIMLGQLEKVVTTLYGERQEDIDGEVTRKGGLVKLFNDFDQERRNGGVHAHVKLSTAQKIAVFAIATPAAIELVKVIAEWFKG